MSFKIRQITKGDLEKIARIESESGYSNWSEETLAKEISFPRSYNLLACSGEKLLGYTFSWLLGMEHEIQNIVVSSERRREGIASALIDSLLEDARGFGAKISLLEVAESNSRAISLYEKAGFEQYFIRKNYYPNGDDAVLMKRDL